MFNKNILVIYGGYSTEREVSMETGENIFESLVRQGYKATKLILVNDKSQVLEQVINFLKDANTDLVVNALHGEFGEDGHLQAMLDTLEITYAGSGVLASSLGMDKARLYDILGQYRLRVPQTKVLYPESTKEQVLAIKAQLALPVIVKPNEGGSSIGVTKVTDWKDLENALKIAFASSNTAIIQEFIQGVEITCPVINGLALPVGEITIDSSNSFFDYDAKFNSKLTQKIFPANLPQEVLVRTQELSVQVHNIIGARGLTRSDFIYNPETREIVFLEINTSPGMTSGSLSPRSALAYGWDFDRLVKEMLNCY
ncbi:MAG: D-alanine--D-alanine ligase [Candidatus Parcubacteria bacterium]|nr:D-alanine--D-alanine ligase [Candidatus Paceibacterota bacterium]